MNLPSTLDADGLVMAFLLQFGPTACWTREMSSLVDGRSIERAPISVCGRPLIAMRQLKHRLLVPRPAENLQSQRQPSPVKTTWHADRRQTEVVGEHGVFGGQREGIVGRFLDRRSCPRRGWEQ